MPWSHLCLKPPSMSHAQPHVRVVHTRRLYAKVWPRQHPHIFPLFWISGTIGPIEPKFCMHMECDQTIISHNKIKLIWGHLGYANEGQRSNLILFCISGTVGPIEPKFCMHMECQQTIILHSKIKLIWGHLGYANEGQRSNLILFCISGTVVPIEPNFCMHMECDQTIKSHNKMEMI